MSVADPLIADLPGLVLVLDAAGTVRNCNQALLRDTGHDLPGITRLALPQLLAPADRESARQALESALGGTASRFEASVLRQDGTTCSYAVMASPHASGAVLVGVPKGDSSAEDPAATAAHQQLDALVRGAEVAIATMSLEGMITSWNAGAERQFGYTATQILGRPMLVLMPSGLAHEARDTLLRTARGEEVRHFDTERMRKDGSIMSVSSTVTPMRNAAGEVIGASVIMRDISGRRRMEAALRDSELRFRSTLDSILEGCQLLGFDWRYLYVNEAAAVQNRRPARDLLGRTMPECWPGIEDTPVFAMLRRTMEERVPLQSEVEFGFPDGSVAHFEVRAQPVPEGLFILSIDTTERQVHGLELERLNRLYDARSHISQAIVRQPERAELFREVCRILVECGGFAMAWIGFPDAAALRMQPMASWGDEEHYLDQIEIRLDDSPEGRGPTALALRQGQAQVCNDLFADESTRPWRSDYERRGYRASAAFPIVVNDEPGGVLSVYARECGFFQQREIGLLQEAVNDVGFALELAMREAERVAARRQADTERRFADAIIESLPGVAYFYDEAGHFLRWNHNFLAVTGYPPEAMATLHPRDFFLGEDRRRVEAAIATTFAEGECSVQAGFVARDGTTTAYYFTGRRLDLNGRRYLVGVGIDISARESAEAEVRRLNTELEARIEERTRQLEIANRELESFSYSVSHDLRAPLRAVNGYCDILFEDHAAQVPEEMQQYLHRIRDAGRRMGDLIDDLLDFSRLSRQTLNRVPVDMNALARQAVQEVEPQGGDRRVEFRIDPLPPCRGDPSLLRQVWINLVSNAVKYTRGRALAVVQIGSAMLDGLPVYFVRDNGIGFDMRYAGKLFGVFQRLHRADQFEGTGVGLAIVHRVLQRHGGRIWAEAAPDRGATFHFTVSPEPAT